MAKETTPTGTTTRHYVVLRRDERVYDQLIQLGVVEAKGHAEAKETFLTYDPQTLIGIPLNRWNETADMKLFNKPEVDPGTPVQLVPGQMTIDEPELAA